MTCTEQLLIEIVSEIEKLKSRALVAEVLQKGAEDRAKLLIEAKDMWMQRALEAEKR
jgi:hypothetical protein